MRVTCLALITAATGCFSGSNAAPDVNAAWRGHARVELEGRLGQPTLSAQQPDGSTALRWIAHGVNIKSLPSAYLDFKMSNGHFSLDAEAKAGEVERYDYILANALIAPGGSILDLDCISLAAGIPTGVNIRTGAIMGLAGGMAVSGDASTPIPSVDMYIGGMIGPRLGLVGSYSFMNAKNPTDGYAMAHAWAFGVQYWPATRVSLRLAPAAVLSLDPGLENARFRPGAVGNLSYAIVHSGSFVLDARLQAVASTTAAFGMLALGVNVN